MLRAKGIGFDLLCAAVKDAPVHAALPCRIALWVVNRNVEPILAWLGFEETGRHDGGSCHMDKWLPPVAHEIRVRVPDVVYHVAPRGFREIIGRDGLVPGLDLEATVAGVSAWRDQAAARRCCAEYTGLRQTEHDVWEIDTVDVPWQDDPQVVGGVVTPLPVPTYRLALVADLAAPDARDYLPANESPGRELSL